MGFEEGEEVQSKGIDNIFKEIIAENFQISRKRCHPGTGSLQDNKQT
jgi:hypothetical protein